jgi:signal transduction histidine kinase
LTDKPVLLNDLVEEQLLQIKELNQHKTINVETDFRNPLRARIPERLFCICINNLISNAFNYTEEGTIRVQIIENSIVIEDTGCGIHPNALKRVHEPFYRENRESIKVKGFGLGLSIVYRVCEQLGWKLSIESQQKAGTKAILQILKPEQ